MRLLIIGYGRMGRLIESLSPAYGFDIAGIFDIDNNADGRALASPPAADVAIEFSTASATVQNLPLLARHGINIVVGTTGWHEHEPELRRIIAETPVGVVAASNFSLGANLFQSIVEYTAKQFGRQADYGAWIHEAHHAAKKDAPSGTAVTLKAAMEGAGYMRAIDVSSTRAGSIPGTHTVGFDGSSDTVTLTHTNRDRGAFARGALEAARWVIGRRGWFGMKDVIGLE
ncbi:MAG: 4-hydroxy-tetrahydrodipicolinate reductase [Acidobacteria bacterium]|nr:MAG: 4-hydroxy-tetrahydrodipicolinate reductase [Acidobacteriota bacterium]